jgi:energy-coupling factor transporter ATP-binding protein EcfA2
MLSGMENTGILSKSIESSGSVTRPSENAIIRTEMAAFRYPQGAQGLNSISLQIEAGEMVIITGASGSGKSTLARCLTGLIPHLYNGSLEGSIHLDDLETTKTPLWVLTERAGLVFQNPASQILAPSVEEEILFGLENNGLKPKEMEARLEEILSQLDLLELRKRSPRTLSGGEQQKLALATAIARRPKVLVLDEPLSMLDTTAAQQLVEHAVQMNLSGTTVVFCEHREEYFTEIPQLTTIQLDGYPKLRVDPSSLDNPFNSIETTRVEIDDLQVELGGRPVLSDINLSLSGGQIIAVVGRNGVGKTTLLRSLAGLQHHDGMVSVNGGKPEFGMVFQNPDWQLFNPTVKDEMLYGLRDPDMDHYHWLMEALGLMRYTHTPPLLLSEGEKKRLTMAMVLMHRPRHGILLDEPALGLDDVHKRMLVGILRALASSGQIVLISTHDLSLAAQADRLILLGPEGIIADGPTTEVMSDRDAWDRLRLRLPEWIRHDPPGEEDH